MAQERIVVAAIPEVEEATRCSAHLLQPEVAAELLGTAAIHKITQAVPAVAHAKGVQL